jgi:hypothetical protein
MLGGLVAPVIFGTLPQWEYTLFFYAEVAGILTGSSLPCYSGSSSRYWTDLLANISLARQIG